MIGGMSASFVSATTPLMINTASGLSMAIQADVLDMIAPGLLSLGCLLYTSRLARLIEERAGVLED